MAERCRVSLAGYKKWENLGQISITGLSKLAKGIQVLVPNMPPFEFVKIEDEDFLSWLEETLRGLQEPPVTASDRALVQLISDWELWKALGGSTALSFMLRQKLTEYREDLDKEDWIAVIRLLQAGQLKESEWQFKDPEVMARRMRFKAPKGTVLSESQWAKIERIVGEEIVKLQAEAKQKGKENE